MQFDPYRPDLTRTGSRPWGYSTYVCHHHSVSAKAETKKYPNTASCVIDGYALTKQMYVALVPDPVMPQKRHFDGFFNPGCDAGNKA